MYCQKCVVKNANLEKVELEMLWWFFVEKVWLKKSCQNVNFKKASKYFVLLTLSEDILIAEDTQKSYQINTFFDKSYKT